MTTLGLICSFWKSGTLPPSLLTHRPLVISCSHHFEVLRAGKVWLVMMGLGGGLPIQVSSKWEEPSGTLVTHPLWSEHTSTCPSAYWDASHLVQSPDSSEGKESVQEEKRPRASNC